MSKVGSWTEAIYKMYHWSKNRHLAIQLKKSTAREQREELEAIRDVLKLKFDAKDKEIFYDLLLVKPENIPDAYFIGKETDARNKGEVPKKREEMVMDVINDQKEKLDAWLDYFYTGDGQNFDTWAKYWVLTGLSSLGKYDHLTGKFSKRDKTTVYPFPEINKECVVDSVNLMKNYLGDLNDENYNLNDELKSAIGQMDFKRLYELQLRRALVGRLNVDTNDGIWVKYEHGDNDSLFESLKGTNTGWCIEAEKSAVDNYLNIGDFYIYYSYDKDGNPVMPRITIRTVGNKIAEIKGIADKQNLEVGLDKVVEKKLEEFPDKRKYEQRLKDMKLLARLYDKENNNQEFTLEELKFLYEIDRNIECFGYEKDPRILEIKSKRNTRKDCARIFNCALDEVALSQKEWEESPSTKKVLIGNLFLNSLISADGLKLPEALIDGNLYLPGLTSALGLELPRIVLGDVNLAGLVSSEGLKLKDMNGSYRISGSLILNGLENADGLELPDIIGGSLNMRSLPSAKNLKFPRKVGAHLYLNSLTSAENLEFPQEVDGDMVLHNLKESNGLRFPRLIGNSLIVQGVDVISDTRFPEIVGEDFIVDATYISNTELPKIVGTSFIAWKLKDMHGSHFPESIGKDFLIENFNHTFGIDSETLEKDEIIFPKSIGGNLIAHGLKSFHYSGITHFPERVDGAMIFGDRLTSAEGLLLPSDFDLSKLYVSDKVKMEIMQDPDKYYMNSSKNTNVDSNTVHIMK